MGNVLLSVAVTTYNHKAYIAQCLESILAQCTDFDFEIILGDDNSNDGTKELCMRYANKYPKTIKLFQRDRNDVIYINKRPTGRYNFIENMKAASGKYIALCDGDDYWTDTMKLQKQVDFLEANVEFSGCFHNVMCTHDAQSKAMYPWRNYNEDTFSEIDTLTHRSLFHTSSYTFRNEDLVFPEWFYKIVSGDMGLLAIISKKGRLKLLEGEMSVYRKNEGGVTANEKKIQFHNDRIQLIGYINDFFQKKYDLKAQEVIAFHKSEINKLRHKGIKKLFRRLKNKLK